MKSKNELCTVLAVLVENGQPAPKLQKNREILVLVDEDFWLLCCPETKGITQGKDTRRK